MIDALTADDVLEALRVRGPDTYRCTTLPGTWDAYCPVCNSALFKQRSLTISQNGSGPRLRCENGCEPAAVLAELGLHPVPNPEDPASTALALVRLWTAAPDAGIRAAGFDPAAQANAVCRLKLAETDMGNARRIVLDHRTSVRYVPGMGWLSWADTHWARDVDGQAMRHAKRTVRGIELEAAAMYEIAALEPDESKREKALKAASARLAHAKRSQQQPRLEALLACASTEPEFVLHADKLDADPWLLNAPNGTVELRTGTVREHRLEDHITKLTGTAIDVSMSTPLHDEYLATTFAGDIALIDCFKRRAGYTLTGETREQCLFIAAGDGANGKTTGLETIAAAMGDYAMTVDPVTFTTAASDRAARSDIARLRGARMVLGSEIDEGAQLAKPLLKQLTGGDMVVARFLYREEFEFRPVMKPWLVVNHLPRVGSDDHAIWRRLQVIPFNVRIQRPDKSLARKLRAELPGILAWMVQGCLDWQRQGLGSCGAMDHAGAAYRQREDRVALFLDECCEIDSAARVENGALRDAYHAWEKDRGGVPVSDLLDQLEKRGFAPYRTKTARGRVGLRLTTDSPRVTEGDG